MQHVIARIPATEILIPVGGWNGHIGAAAGVFSDVNSGRNFSNRRAEGS